MITKKTVFVLGAGSSFPYGFPLGRGLVFEIWDRLSTPNSPERIILESLYRQTGSEINLFKDQMRASSLSVDGYLETHPQHLEMGKVAIAASLIPHEVPDNLLPGPRKLEWYEYLFKQMEIKERFLESAKNLSIITFNYDRSLEYFLYESAVAAFGEKFAIAVMKEIPFIHAYGQLGKPIFLTKCDQDEDSRFRREYNPTVDAGAISKCIHEISIMPERSPDSREFILAHDLISKAEVLCFMGFGYDRTNFERLQLERHFSRRTIYCCITGLSTNEGRRATALFNPWKNVTKGDLQINTIHEDVLEFLRWYPIFD